MIAPLFQLTPSAGVGNHVDAADLELRAFGIDLARLQAREVNANERRRQALVRDHAAFDRVAEIEEAASFAAFGGCFRSLHGGRGAFVPLLYDAFVVERLFYMACGPRTYG